MSDDLVKRLRQSWDADRSIMSQTERWMAEREAAADRIEELEAKLAVAVTHFKKLRRRQDSIETFDAVVNEIVEAALAELTGGNDE